MKTDRFSFNKIYYINADVDNSIHNDLFQTIKNNSIFCSNIEIECDYRFVNSKADLKNYFRQIKGDISNNKFPFLHLTCHGGEKGIKLPSGGRLNWNELAYFLAEINLKSKNNLFVVMACCEGAYISIPMLKNILASGSRRRAPLFGFIGSMGTITLEEIEEGFSSFYECLFKKSSKEGLNIDGAIDELRKVTGSYVQAMSCRSLFERIVKKGLEDAVQKFKSNLHLDSYIVKQLDLYFKKTGILPDVLSVHRS